LDRDEFNRQLAEAARAMARAKGVELTLDRAVEMATGLVESCDLAAVSLVRGTGMTTLAASHEALHRADQLQHELGEGPCVTALRQTDVLVVPNLAEDPRWPRWAPRIARQLGICSVMSFRLFIDEKDLGALTLYATRAHAFTAEDVLDGHVVAAAAAVALAGSLREADLARGLESRRIVGQAIGILRERFGLTQDQAFGVLRTISSHHNIKLHQVAEALVDSGSLDHAPIRQSHRPTVPADPPEDGAGVPSRDTARRTASDTASH
jgi:GAF domain-containing protein